jgi:Tol biopolymer transport system component
MFRKILKWLLITFGVLAVLYILYLGVIFSILRYQHKKISNQGEILNILPDTKFLSDDSLALFFKDGSLYSIELNGLNEKKLCDDVRNYSWAPDGKKVVTKKGVRETDEQIVIIDLSTGAKNIVEDLKMLDLPKDEWYSRLNLPQWSPDSTKLVYRFNKERYKSAIRVYDIQTKIKTEIERPLTYIIGPKWMIDSQNFLYNELFTKKYYKYNINSKEIIVLSPGQDLAKTKWYDIVDINNVHFNQYADSGVWHWGRTSPNGEYRAYNKEGSLWLDKDGKDVLLVEFNGTYNPDFGQSGVGGIEWLPNNRAVLFSFSGKDTETKMYAVDIETKKIGYLAEGRYPMVHIPDFRPADLDKDRPSIMYDSSIYMRDK